MPWKSTRASKRYSANHVLHASFLTHDVIRHVISGRQSMKTAMPCIIGAFGNLKYSCRGSWCRSPVLALWQRLPQQSTPLKEVLRLSGACGAGHTGAGAAAAAARAAAGAGVAVPAAGAACVREGGAPRLGLGRCPGRAPDHTACQR